MPVRPTFSIFLVNYLYNVGYSNISPTIVFLLKSRDISTLVMGAIFILFSIAQTLGASLSYQLSTKIGRIKTFSLALLLYAICFGLFLLMTFAKNESTFILICLFASFLLGLSCISIS